jgi:hypothetical protein
MKPRPAAIVRGSLAQFPPLAGESPFCPIR